MRKSSFTEEQMEKLIDEWKEAGRPSYSTFHQKKKDEAKERGEGFTASSTFRKALVDRKLLPDSKGSPSESSTKGPEYLEFLEAHLRDDVKENPEASYWKWKAEGYKEEVEELKRK